jgi:hypothetical protein
MKLKKIIIAGAKAAFGIRMVKDTAAVVCTPKVTGLFLLDDDLEWTVTETEIVLTPGLTLPSFIPIRLLGETCGAEVQWETSWEASYHYGHTPLFWGSGPVGVVGWQMEFPWEVSYYLGAAVAFRICSGVLTVTASCGGVTYGPVTIRIVYGE